MSDKEKIDAVKDYLDRYIECCKAVESLKRRIQECEDDFNDPSIGGGASGSCAGGTSFGAASLTFRKDNLESLYREQCIQAKQTMNDIAKAIISIPFCDGRDYIELRYLTGLSVRAICKQKKISHTTYYTESNNALLMLYPVLVENGLIEEAKQ